MALSEEILKKLNKIYGKFMATQGLPVWGTIVKVAQNDFRVLYVDDDGKLVVSASISGTVDISDRAARLLGVVYGSQSQKLLQRASTYESIVQLSHQGTEYDGRDISDKWARQLGLVDLSRVLGAALSASNPVIAGVYDVSGNRMPSMDVVGRAGFQKITDGTETLSIDASNRAETAPVQTTRTNLTVKPEREDGTSLGGTLTPNAAGVQVLAPSGSLKPKVFDAGYECAVAGLHYFYFGTSTTATTRRFCTRKTAGVIHKTFVQPRVGNAADGIYGYSAVNETSMDYDLNYVLEA